MNQFFSISLSRNEEKFCFKEKYVSRPYLYMKGKSSTQSVHFSCVYLIIESVRMSDGSEFENFHLQVIETLLYFESDWNKKNSQLRT